MRIVRQCCLAAVVAAALLSCAGCPVAGEVTTRLAAIQLPPGKLYSGKFYLTATPEEVRAEIGGRSLAEERYIEKDVARSYNTGAPSIAGDMIGLFFSDAYVRETDINPLQAAILNTPYPEVLALLLEAGAGQYREREQPGYIHRAIYFYLFRHSDARSLSLLLPYLPEDPDERFLGFFGRGDSAGEDTSVLDRYLELFPEANVNCRGKDGTTPLEQAINRAVDPLHRRQMHWLLSRGASLELTVSSGRTPLAHALEQHRSPRWSPLHLLLEYGPEIASLTPEERGWLKEYLMDRSDFAFDLTKEELGRLEKRLGRDVIAARMTPKEARALGRLYSLPLAERAVRVKEWLQ